MSCGCSCPECRNSTHCHGIYCRAETYWGEPLSDAERRLVARVQDMCLYQAMTR